MHEVNVNQIRYVVLSMIFTWIIKRYYNYTYLYGGNFTQVHTSNLLTLLIFNEYTQVLITRFNRMLLFFNINLPRSTEIVCSV